MPTRLMAQPSISNFTWGHPRPEALNVTRKHRDRFPSIETLPHRRTLKQRKRQQVSKRTSKTRRMVAYVERLSSLKVSHGEKRSSQYPANTFASRMTRTHFRLPTHPTSSTFRLCVSEAVKQDRRPFCFDTRGVPKCKNIEPGIESAYSSTGHCLRSYCDLYAAGSAFERKEKKCLYSNKRNVCVSTYVYAAGICRLA